MPEHTWIDGDLLDDVTRAALAAPRGRRNHNFHRDETALCHRLLNAVEPGSYIRPHRHADSDKDEALIVLRGRLGRRRHHLRQLRPHAPRRARR